MSLHIRWTTLFIDTPRPDAAQAWQFWSQVTGDALAPPRGDTGQFSTLLPATADAWVKLQALDDGPARVHLDLAVDDPAAASAAAQQLGATELGVYAQVVHVMASPGGFVFCLTSWQNEGCPSRQDRTGRAVLVDQICLDLPRTLHDRELEFWTQLTRWPASSSQELPQFTALHNPASPVRMLVQRLDSETGTASAHLDLACTDRPRATHEHVTAGATVVREYSWWTVLQDPTGASYCLTDREVSTSRPATTSPD